MTKKLFCILTSLYHDKIIPLLTKKNIVYILNIILDAINEQTSSSSDPILLTPFSNMPPDFTGDVTGTISTNLDIINNITSVSGISYVTNSGSSTQSGTALPGIQCTVNYDITSLSVNGSATSSYTLPCSGSYIDFGIVIDDSPGNPVGGGTFSINSSTIAPVDNLSQTFIIPFNITNPVSGTYTLMFDFGWSYCNGAISQTLSSNSYQISISVP
jgi:hypothetical protein